MNNISIFYIPYIILVEQHSNKTTPIPRIQIETKPMEKVIV